MAKSKLKAALDAHKGVDYTALKEKKKLRAGEKRSRDKSAKRPKKEEDVDVDMSEDDEEGGVLIDEEAVGTEIEKSEEKKLQAELKALLGDKKKLMEIDSGSEVDEDEEEEDEEEWESAAEEIDGEDDEDEDEDASDDEQQGVCLVNRIIRARADLMRIDLSRLVDSDSDSESEDDEADAPKPKLNGKSKTNGTTKHSTEDASEDEEEGSDIPLSDIESLASEDRGDIVPHQRLTINNKAALKKALDRISLPLSSLPFSAHQVVISQTNTANSIPDIDDDLARELAFYSQSLAAVKEARTKLTKEGTPFTRPMDYFAEMVKSDEHMGKVKDKLRDEAAGKKAAAEARRQRDLKKFGKQVQVAKLQERAKEKRDTLDRINVLKRKRAGAMPDAETEPDLFDVSLEDSATTAKKDREARRTGRSAGGASGAPNAKRQKKDAKFGFGGKKRFSKSTDAESAADMRAFPGKGMKKPFKGARGGGGGGAKSGGKTFRPGKSKRVQARS